MPRPGPRPYECVKRAWHSDRHQPIRGSLIREIFRIANEIHSPATRKNKEWQEKLPSVVFKAEEIMYSKASSEDEYVDLSNLWERANDAIDTIIRRDDVNESGNLLLPCIEAALTLGCIPRRASRSQRHSNPRCYLSSGTEESLRTSASSQNITDGNKPLLGPVPYSLRPSMIACPGNLQAANTQFTSWFLATDCPQAVASDFFLEMRSAGLVPSTDQKASISISCPGFHKLWSCVSLVLRYPNQNVESCSSFREPLDSSCNGMTVGGVPYGSSAGQIGGKTLRGSDKGRSAQNESSNLRDKPEIIADGECDLSLHLSLPSTTSTGADHRWAPEIEDMGSSSSLDGSKFHEMPQNQVRAVNFECRFSSPQNHNGLFFNPPEVPGEPLESCSSKRSFEDEDALYVDTLDRRRRALHDDLLIMVIFG
ncbi:unnamed protein product [Spirodela intermedia]|uniref:Uncharacterized protein n=1 Tax=Spirodela intermedia TaxID=51605 RepID=A0A7I8JR85_SPIIN|nr:unnamed protein product [Spirodela intermedia]CAA6672654.1 unnamed protein product [Spirodela intermedia]